MSKNHPSVCAWNHYKNSGFRQNTKSMSWRAKPKKWDFWAKISRGPQINPRPFCGRQMSENVVFRERGDFGKMPILHSSAVLGRTPADQIFSRFFGFFKGWPKNREKPVFFGCLMCRFFFFLYRLLMVTCRLDIPSCLQMCHSSLLSYFWCYVFLLSGGCVSLFYSSLFFLCSLLFIWLFVFVVFSLGVTETQIKSENISNFDCHLLLRCLHPHTFTWPR